MATFVDEINSCSYLYPVELPSKKVIFKWYAICPIFDTCMYRCCCYFSVQRNKFESERKLMLFFAHNVIRVNVHNLLNHALFSLNETLIIVFCIFLFPF